MKYFIAYFFLFLVFQLTAKQISIKILYNSSFLSCLSHGSCVIKFSIHLYLDFILNFLILIRMC
jgi:hypothetical protein